MRPNLPLDRYELACPLPHHFIPENYLLPNTGIHY